MQAKKEFDEEKKKKPREDSLPRIKKPFFVHKEEDPLKDIIFKSNIVKRPRHLKEKFYGFSRTRRVNNIMQSIVDSEIIESPAKQRVKELLSKISSRNSGSTKHRRFYSVDMKKEKDIDADDAKWHYKYQEVHVNKRNITSEYDFSKENARRMLPQILKQQEDVSSNDSRVLGNQFY
jgi:hypothetical protein